MNFVYYFRTYLVNIDCNNVQNIRAASLFFNVRLLLIISP